MKISHSYLVLLIAILLIGACKSDNTEIDYNPHVTASKDYVFAENIYIGIFNLYFKAIHDQLLLNQEKVNIDSCEVSYNIDNKMMLFSYGNNPQTCPDGRSRVGFYTVTFDGDVNELGTNAVFDFDTSYHLDEGRVIANANSAYTGVNNSGKAEHTFHLTNGQIVIPDTLVTTPVTINYSCDYLMTFEEGQQTPGNPDDDLLLVTGTSSARSTGNYRSSLSVSEPLYDYLDCLWIYSGIHAIQIEGVESPDGRVDYIDEEECNNQVNFYFGENLFYTLM